VCRCHTYAVGAGPCACPDVPARRVHLLNVRREVWTDTIRAGAGACPYDRYDSSVHHRRSIRLHGYDYAQPGAYAVTICSEKKQFLFGEIVGGKVVLNDLGRMVQNSWEQMPAHYPGCELDRFVVMPNHLHGIILITDVGAAPAPARVHLKPTPMWRAPVPARKRRRPTHGRCHCRI